MVHEECELLFTGKYCICCWDFRGLRLNATHFIVEALWLAAVLLRMLRSSFSDHRDLSINKLKCAFSNGNL